MTEDITDSTGSFLTSQLIVRCGAGLAIRASQSKSSRLESGAIAAKPRDVADLHHDTQAVH